MKPFSLLFVLALAGNVWSADSNNNFIPLFNGRDLTGWVNANCAPETWSVRNGVIHCTGTPTGALRTERQYENFILEVEWRHLRSGGNSGVFIWGTPIAAPGVPFLRGIEVQVLDNGYSANGKNEWYTTHGDVFPIHGATMKPLGRSKGQRSFPSEEKSKSSPEWNHYRVVGSNGVIRLHVNGKEVSGGDDCNYRKGYLALESEGSPVEFRNIRLQELPPSNTPADLVAPLDTGLRTIFTGLELRGWKTNAATAKRWQSGDGRLALKQGSPDAEALLWSEKEFGDAEFVLDCRPAKTTAAKESPVVQLRGADGESTAVKLAGATPGNYQRFVISVKGREVTVKLNEQEIQRLTLPENTAARGAFGLRDTGGAVDFMNLYARDL